MEAGAAAILVDKLGIEPSEVLNQVGGYGALIVKSLYMLIGALLIIFLIHSLATRFIFPRIKNNRLIKVVFGTLYTLILVMAVLVTLKQIGIEIKVVSHLAILFIIIGAVLVFLLLPFFPRLPFKLGHMVEVNGVVGIVDSISSFHTTIRKFDGTMVFIPNALVMATKIMNFHDTPSRRIEMNLVITVDSEIQAVQAEVTAIMRADERVLDEPSPPLIFINQANANGIEMSAYCWVNNADWLATRSDLWSKLISTINADERINFAVEQQKIHLVKDIIPDNVK